MYVGWSMIHLGTALALRSPGMSITWPVSVVLVHRGIRGEEDPADGRRSATTFTALCRSVPRYLGLTLGADPHPVSPCSCAYAAAAVRDDTSSLTKMLLR